MTSGDAWQVCAAGHRHWGAFGAAGLLVTDGVRIVMQHRAAWTHEGDQWGIPGGALHHDEDVVSAALREAHEEAGILRADVNPVGTFVDDHGGWSYTTVLAHVVRPFEPRALTPESVSIEWFPFAEVARLSLHPGFAAAWPTLSLQLGSLPQ